MNGRGDEQKMDKEEKGKDKKDKQTTKGKKGMKVEGKNLDNCCMRCNYMIKVILYKTSVPQNHTPDDIFV